MKSHRLRILVAGRLAAAPGQGGAAWALLQWLLGLRALGHVAWLVEPMTAPPLVMPAQWSRQTRYFRNVTRRFGLAEHASIVHDGTDAMVRLGRDYDLLVNMSGVLNAESVEGIPVRLYVDLDPGFTQLWHTTGVDVGLDGHTHFATVGQRIGDAESVIPNCGRTWIPVLPPVVLDHWPVQSAPRRERFTTVANWRSYGSIQHGGRFFGQKAHSFREYRELPALTSANLEVALAISPGDDADRTLLEKLGWRLLDASRMASTPDAYRRFIQRSSAEIGLAKSGYVEGRTGWFSDRSAAYLASGRPVVAQDTGLDGRLSNGLGLVTFADVEQAVEGIERVRREYASHAAGAREIAAEHLDALAVLPRLLRGVGLT